MCLEVWSAGGRIEFGQIISSFHPTNLTHSDPGVCPPSTMLSNLRNKALITDLIEQKKYKKK